MTLKTLRHHPNPDEARQRWLGFLKGDFAETAIGCLRVARVYDSETFVCVRQTALASEEERDHQAALEYFKAGMSLAQLRHEKLRTAIGDFSYHRRGTLRPDAATFLAERGCSRRKGIVRGASKDLERLQSVADGEHEETIRTILMNTLPDDYERRLRAILFARARRKM